MWLARPERLAVWGFEFASDATATDLLAKSGTRSIPRKRHLIVQLKASGFGGAGV